MPKKLTLAVLLAAFLCPAEAQDEPSLAVGPVVLSLGMAQATVLAAFTAFYKLDEVGDTWSVAEKSGRSQVAWLKFRSGKLASVGKKWMSSDDSSDSANYVNALVGALEDLGCSRGRRCDVATGRDSAPSVESKRVWITCGIKRVVVSRMDVTDPDSRPRTFVSIFEELGSP